MPRAPKKTREWRTQTEKVSAAVAAVKACGYRSSNEFIEAFYTSEFHSSQALRYQPKAKYSPEILMDKWVDNVPAGESKKKLHSLITQKATDIMVRESARACKKPALQMNPGSLDIPYLVGDTNKDFGFKQIHDTYMAVLPCLYFLIYTLLTAPNEYERRNGLEKEGKRELADRIVVVIISILLYSRNNGTNAFQTVMGVFLASSGASRRIIDNFNHMGLCVSYWTIQRALKRLSEASKSRAQDFLSKSGRLCGVVYDNINFTLRKTSQRLDSGTQQINATTMALFSLPHKFTQKAYAAALSVAERCKLAGGRRKLKRDDLMLTKERNEQMEAAFKHGIRMLLITYLPGKMKRRRRNKHLRKKAEQLMPKIRPIGHSKTDFFPLPALNQEEASVPGTVTVVTKLYTTLLGLACELVDSQLRLLVGDWLSVRNLRLMKWERKHERKSFDRFQWVQEASMPFHFQLNAIYALFRTHLGTLTQDNPSSLEHHRTLLRRAKLDAKKPEYNKAKELVFHSLAARLLDCTRLILHFNSYDDLKKWRPSWQEFDSVVEQIYRKYTCTSAASAALKSGDEYLAHSILFMRDALIFWEFCDAIRYADAGRMWVVYDFWIFMMRGAGCHNYGNELLEMKAQFEHEFPPLLREVVERTWLVNRWGKKGRSIPTDLYLEHNNGFTKNMFAAMGACASVEHVQNKSSACVEVLRSLAHKVSEWNKVRDFNRKHKEVSVDGDLAALCGDMMAASLHTATAGRTIPLVNKKAKKTTSKKAKKESAVVDVLTKGMKALIDGKLYENWLRRTAGVDLEGEGDEQGGDGEEIDWDIQPAFADPDGTMAVDAGADEDFPECPFANTEVSSVEADN